MRFLVAITIFLALIGAEYFALPWIEPIFGPDLVTNGPGWLLLPVIGGYLGWLITENWSIEVIREKIKSTFHFFCVQLGFYRERLNTLPAVMQLFAALSLTMGVFNLSSEYNQFIQLFAFVTALVSIADAYKNNENYHTAIFILIACLYNPVYPIALKIDVWMVVNCLVAIIFAYKVSFIFSREKRLNKDFLKIALKIDDNLKEIEKSTRQYSLMMLEGYIKHKHPYLTFKDQELKWQETGLEDFTFQVVDVFNGQSAIRVTGNNAFDGISVFLVFHNQHFRWMIFLEQNAGEGAKRLKKIMVHDLHYICFETSISQS